MFDPGNIDIFFSDLEEMGGIEIIEFKDVKDSKSNGTGSLALDIDLVNPIPDGSMIEIYGDESSGKTSLALEIIGQSVNMGKVALYVDQERSLQRSLVRSIRTLRPYIDSIFSDDKEARQKCPVKLLRANSGEKALESVRRFATAFPKSIIVVDSVDALVPESKMSEDIGKPNMGSHAKLMSEALRILSHDVGVAESTVIFLNQKREKVGLIFGDPTVTGGGRSLKFYSWQRIELLKPGNAQRILDPDKNIVGHRVRYKIIKNKTAPTAGADGDFPLLYGKGIWRELELIDQCAKFGVLKHGGRGGKQVILPIVTDGNIEEKVMSKFNASRRLLIDSRTRSHVEQEFTKFRAMMKKAPESEDEIQDIDGA
jgi:recombination protein RecA